jgi:hypothetical protein
MPPRKHAKDRLSVRYQPAFTPNEAETIEGMAIENGFIYTASFVRHLALIGLEVVQDNEDTEEQEAQT